MGEFYYGYHKGPGRRGLTNNSTSTSFPAIVPIDSAPATVDSTTATGNLLVIPLHGSVLHLFPFGLHASAVDNKDFHMRVTLIRTFPGLTSSFATLTAYKRIGIFACTCSSAQNGVAGASLLDTEAFADTITEVSTSWLTDMVTVHSNAADLLATIEITPNSFEYAQVDFDVDAGAAAATSANVCYSLG